MKEIMIRLIAVFAVAGTVFSAHSQLVLVEYDLAGAVGDEVSRPATTEASGITALDLTRGPGLLAESGAGSFNSRSFSTSATVDADDYLSFGIDSSVNPFEIDTISLELRRSGSGPQTWALRSDVDAFASDITTLTLGSDSATAFDVPLDATFAGLNSIEFRLFGFDAGSSVGTGRINELSLTAVPEPRYTALACAISLIIFARWRHVFTRG